MFPYLQELGRSIENISTIANLFSSKKFQPFNSINIMPLIYNEKQKRCNIMVFNCLKAIKNTAKILFLDKNKKFDFENQKVIDGRGREHPIYMFLDKNGNYICEVRYGGASANALQRGLWTHTKNALPYFDSLTDGWVDYSFNKTLVKLFSLALNATQTGHEKANKILQEDIDRFKLCK
jgi:hypothetical protein